MALLRASIDEIDVLVAELAEVRDALERAEAVGRPEDALWDAEATLRRVAQRSDARAGLVRRAIELHREHRAT